MIDLKKAEGQDLRRRRRERYLIVSLFIVISFFIYMGIRVFDMDLDLPISNNILIFTIININVILLLLLLFLTFRNIVKLVFERKRNIMGARLRTRLVMAFVSLSLLPTIILFFVSVQFISSAIEYWFNLQIEQSLKKSLEVGQEYYHYIGEDILARGNNISRLISYEKFTFEEPRDRLLKLIEDKRREYNLAAIELYGSDLQPIVQTRNEDLDLSQFKGVSREVLARHLQEGTDGQAIQTALQGDLVSGIVPVFSGSPSKAVIGLALFSEFVPGRFVNRLNAINRGLQEYRQLKMLKTPLKVSHLISLSIVTLLIVFASIWFGFYLSKEITIPINELAEGTHRIASGDYDFFIDLEARDEIGELVNSFNRMTTDLRISKGQLENANRELVRSNLELEQRRQYMEIVLANIAAGVFSADEEGRILTLNKSAERMLGISAMQAVGRHYGDALVSDCMHLMEELLADRGLFRKGAVTRQVQLVTATGALTVLASFTVLRDDKARYLGVVGVLEDLSDMEKAQRMAAWREVATRIAHEVKNPLTPIALSAQRMKKRYADKLRGDDARVLTECTDMIIRQVDELKQLVNEFSNFARMPTAKRLPTDIRELIQEAMSVYREAHKTLRLTLSGVEELPPVSVDREQLKRVLINLIENAVEAMEAKGEVGVEVDYNPESRMARVVVADSGKGIPPDYRRRIFEPYFSTKKQGTGLGLAIVNTIVTDHKGSVHVEDNLPCGTRMVIELPVVT